MKIIQIEQFEMMTPKHPTKPGLLVNVHLSSIPPEDEMDQFAQAAIAERKSPKYIAVSIVYWLRVPRKQRLKCIELWNSD